MQPKTRRCFSAGLLAFACVFGMLGWVVVRERRAQAHPKSIRACVLYVQIANKYHFKKENTKTKRKFMAASEPHVGVFALRYWQGRGYAG